jgi:hypothetical protein
VVALATAAGEVVLDVIRQEGRRTDAAEFAHGAARGKLAGDLPSQQQNIL